MLLLVFQMTRDSMFLQKLCLFIFCLVLQSSPLTESAMLIHISKGVALIYKVLDLSMGWWGFHISETGPFGSHLASLLTLCFFLSSRWLLNVIYFKYISYWNFYEQSMHNFFFLRPFQVLFLFPVLFFTKNLPSLQEKKTNPQKKTEYILQK